MIYLYIEGSGKLRDGFQHLFRQFAGVRIIMGKGNGQTVRDWRRESSRRSNSHHLLLIDSEGPLSGSPEPDQFFMVELMESWFLGDPEKLAAYFGGNFNAGAVPRRPVEDIPKKEVLVALDRAVKDTPKKKYLKARDSKELLRYIRLDIVRNAPAPNCDGLLRRLESLSPQPREPLLDASG